MSKTRKWKVYGADGHRQKGSFLSSVRYDWSSDQLGTRIVGFENSDITGTNEYTIVEITRNTAEECERELWGQITDGYFENYKVGKVVEI